VIHKAIRNLARGQLEKHFQSRVPVNMIRGMKRLLCGTLCSMLLVGWAAAAQLDLTEAENGKDILLDRGDLLLVHLPSNRTTGYGWRAVSSKPGKLEELGKPALNQPKSSRGLVGAGGVETWTFRAAASGRTTLAFSYARPWETGVPPVRTLSWPVTIRPSLSTQKNSQK